MKSLAVVDEGCLEPAKPAPSIPKKVKAKPASPAAAKSVARKKVKRKAKVRVSRKSKAKRSVAPKLDKGKYRTPEGRFAKTQYMRDYMAARRAILKSESK
jgi:hypothetical protein